MFQCHTLHRYLALINPARNQKASQAWQTLVELQQALQRSKEAIGWELSIKSKRSQGKAAAGRSSLPVTCDAMQKAQEVLRPARPELSGATLCSISSSTLYKQEEVQSIKQMALTSTSSGLIHLPAAAGTLDNNAQLVDAVEQLAEAIVHQVDSASANGNLFDQNQVVKGDMGKEENSNGNSNKQDAICFCVTWLQFLLDASYAHHRELRLLEFMEEASFCPLCPFAQNNGFAASGGGQSCIGLFGDHPGAWMEHGNLCSHDCS